MKKKKLRFQYCTALFATTLLVGTNCVVATASELENIETRAPAFSKDETASAVNDTEELNVPKSPPDKIPKMEDTIPNNKNPIENLIEISIGDTPAEPDSIVSDREDIIDELPVEPEYTPPDSEHPDKDTPTDPEYTIPDSERPAEDTPVETEGTPPDSECPPDDTSAETEGTPPDSECPPDDTSAETEDTASDRENIIGNEDSQTEDIILDSENTLSDVEETNDSNEVRTICARIDALPTVDQLYADVPGVEDAAYDLWLSAMQELLGQISELQEQYRLLTMEEQALVGEERKAKLDALGMLLEEGALFNVNDFFDNEDGLSYKIITENESDNQVSVTTSSNYGALLSSSIQIPSTVEHNGIEYKVTRIDDQAFKDCQQLTSVSIPDSVQSIGNSAFFNCQNLTDITIPNGIQINNKCFEGCIKLSTMKIIVVADTPVSVADANAFLNCPDERQIIFQTPDGTELSSTTTPDLTSVVNIYRAAADGNTDDYLWYGWQLKIPTYNVTINVLKDASAWQDHDRKFALKISDSDEFITDLTDVKNGSYRLYDITNAQKLADGLDTQVTIEIKDSDALSNPVEYYTVTFFDENIPYGTDTPQRPQIILKNYHAVKPSADPVKEGFLFEKWVTANGAAAEFEFENQAITAQTNVYASWTPAEQPDEGYQVLIDIYLDGEKWTENCPKSFVLKLKSSETITSDFNAVANGQYDIYEDTSTGMIDTNVDIDVNGADASVRIDYYTIQFVDENTPYGMDTPQKPQIVLKGQYAAEPEAPSKEGFSFAGWKTVVDSDELYDFENTAITDKISLYATWILADSGDKPGEGENKPGSGDEQPPGEGENKPGGGDEQPPGEGENKPGGGDEQPPGNGENTPGDGDEQPPGDGENKPGGGDEEPPGEGENKPGSGEEQQPGDGENKPGGGDEQPPGEGENKPGSGEEQQPGDGENKPGGGDEQPPGSGEEQQPGDDENKPGGGDEQQPDDGENKPGGGDEQKPDNGNGQKPDDGNDKPGDDGEQQPDNSENKPDNGNQQTPNKDNGQKQNNDNQSNIEISMNTSTFMAAQITALPSEDNAINNSIPSEVITDYSSSGPVKDKEPQTGDEASTGIYAIVAMLANLVLILLHFAEYSDKNILQRVETGQKYWDKKLAKQRSSIPLNIHRKHNIQNIKKKDRTLEVIWTRKKQYFFSSG